MDPDEKRVLKRKRHMLCSNFTLTPENVELLTKYKLMTPTFLTQVEAEKTEVGKMSKLLDLLMDVPRAFTRLCDLLQSLGPTHAWLCDELQTECLWERGLVKVEAAVEHEASVAVTREFSSSKRLSGENEKRAMVQLVASRTQCARQVWANRLATAQAEVQTMTEEEEATRHSLNSMLQQMITFGRIYQKMDWNDSLHKDGDSQQDPRMQQERQDQHNGESDCAVDNVERDKALLASMRHNIDEINGLVQACHRHRQALEQERHDVIRLITAAQEGRERKDAKEDKKTRGKEGRMDHQLEQVLLQLKRDLVNYQQAEQAHQEQSKQLEAKLNDTKGIFQIQAADEQHTLQNAKQDLVDAQAELVKLDKEREELQERLETIEDQTHEDRGRAHQMYTVRMHGYVSSPALSITD